MTPITLGNHIVPSHANLFSSYLPHHFHPLTPPSNFTITTSQQRESKETANMISSLLFNLLLVSFAMADEMAASAIDNTWKYGTSGGVLGFIVLILDIVVFSTFLSPLLICNPFTIFPPCLDRLFHSPAADQLYPAPPRIRRFIKE